MGLLNGGVKGPPALAALAKTTLTLKGTLTYLTKRL